MENILWQTESVQRFVDIFDEYEGPLLPSGKCLKDNTASYETTKRLHVWTSIGNLEGAIEEANKSICFAETGSSYLGLAYSIRAHFFARLEQYSMCLADIALAEENRYPSFMRPILLERRDDYLEAMNEVDPEDSWPNVEPELSFPSNPKFPCLAHGLEVKHSLQYGKHIITTRDLQIGQTVIVEEAYCIASEPNQKYSQCANCFKRKANLIPCKNCADIMFCSQSCYDIGHESFHAADCGITSICSKWDIVRRMATQTIMKAIKAFSNVDELIDVIRTFIIRESNGEESFYPNPSVRAYMQFFGLRRGFGLTIEILEFTYMTNIKAVHLQVLSNATCNSFFRTDESKRFLGHLIMHHFHIINKNELDAVSLLRGTYINELGANAEHSGGITYAHGIYPNSNQLNHSCQPNVALIFIRNKVAVKVIRPIERGEQLFVSYLNLLALTMTPTSKRKQLLFEKYYFECMCESCIDEYPPYISGYFVHVDVSISRLLSMFEHSPAAIPIRIKNCLVVNRRELLKFEQSIIECLQINERILPTNQSLLIQYLLMQIWNNLGR